MPHCRIFALVTGAALLGPLLHQPLEHEQRPWVFRVVHAEGELLEVPLAAIIEVGHI